MSRDNMHPRIIIMNVAWPSSQGLTVLRVLHGHNTDASSTKLTCMQRKYNVNTCTIFFWTLITSFMKKIKTPF